ncbi:MAG: flagellar basal body rod protein FlgB, partial [Paracoccaceae bacterium]
ASHCNRVKNGTGYMQKIMEHIGVHAQALNLRSQRNEILASNIANASTPNFKARDINFEEELQRQLSASSEARTNAAIQNAELKFRVPTEFSLDGNTVELHVEQMEFAENVARYQATLMFLNQKLAGLKSAIKGE